MLFKSTIVEIGSGKLGGTVYSSGRGGGYIKAFQMPTQTNTNAQLLQQARSSALVQQWRNLTSQEQDAWKAATADYPYVNRVGDTKLLAGYALFMSLNGKIQAATGNPFDVGQVVSVPPGKVELPDLGASVEVNSDVGLLEEIVVDWTNAGTASDFLVLYATRNLSGGITSPSKSAYRYIGTVADTTVAGVSDLAPAYIAKFGASAPSGTGIGLQLRHVRMDTGQETIIEQLLVKIE